MQKHYAEECKLAEIAAQVHLNPSYFSVLFKKHTGESFTAYVTRIRMEKALNLIRRQMRIFEIAAAQASMSPIISRLCSGSIPA